MTVSYNGKKLIPAPQVGIQKTYNRTSDTHRVGSLYTFTVKGVLLPCKGSPNSSGVFWETSDYPPDEISVNQFQSLLAKQSALRKLFANDGQSFEIQPWTGSTPIKCYPIVKELSFPEGTWFDKLEYTITLESPLIYGSLEGDNEDVILDNDFFVAGSGKLVLTDVTEDWQMDFDTEEDEYRQATYKITHNVKAVGKDAYLDGTYVEGWEQARQWVMPRLGLQTSIIHASSGLNLPSYYAGHNYIRNEQIDKFGGSYSISENWIVASGSTTEEFTISTKTSSENGLTQVSIEGTIRGLETRSSDYYTIIDTKFTNATQKWNQLLAGTPVNTILNRAQTYSGKTLNTVPLNTTVGKNPVGGTITYNYEYDNRPSNCIPDSLSENITFRDTNSADIFAKIVVPGRQAGPVLQNMNTVTESRKELSIEVVMPLYDDSCPNTPSNIYNMMTAAPTAAVNVIVQACKTSLENTYNQVFVESDSQEWNPKTGHFTRTVAFVYQQCT